VLEDDQLLRQLEFRLDARAPFRGEHRLPPAALRGYLKSTARYPRLLLRVRLVRGAFVGGLCIAAAALCPSLWLRLYLWLRPPALTTSTLLTPPLPTQRQQAAQLNNLSAILTMARLLETADSAADAMRHWRRAAKLGDVEGQLRAGLAAYHGSCGAAQDPEAASMWLGKALRQVQRVDQGRQRAAATRRGSGAGASPDGGSCGSPATTSSGSGSGSSPTPNSSSSTPHSSSSSSGSGCPPAAASLVAITEATRLRVLREAALVLGYLHFDGEGVSTDKGKATQLFKVAADAGCNEAAQVRGWIFNTGQYE